MLHLIALVACVSEPAPAPHGAAPSPTPDAPVLPQSEAPVVPWVEPARWPAVVINEILPANQSLVMDEAMDFDDFAELYNPTDQPVELAGWGLADDEGDPDWTFPDGVVLAPGGHLVVWLDDEVDEGPLHATVGLAAAGDQLVLFTPDGAIADQWAFTDHPSDVVLGRFPSGAARQASSTLATPGNRNPVEPTASLDPSDALFPQGEALRLDLSLTDAAMDALRADGSVEVPAGLGVGAAWLDVTVSIKGGWGSLRGFDQKAAFRIDIDGAVPGQRLRGLENLTLNNMVQDPSGVHEMLAYALLREAGVPAPRTAHVELWLNGAYRGLYLNVETPDDQFLQRWFTDAGGNLYEGAYGPDFTADGIWWLELDEQGAAAPTDRSDLQPLVDILAQPPSEALMPAFEAAVDLDRTLPMLAGEVITSHWDGYFYYPNNYRVYVEPATGEATLLVWGMDQTFGWAGGIYDAYGDVAEWCLQVPSCRSRYEAAVIDMAGRLAAHDCRGRIEAIFPAILPLYEADPLREASPTDMEAQARYTADYCDSFPASALAQVP